METREHLGLKELAASWLISMGCRAVAHEVPCPVARFRVDAAGWMPDGPRTVVIECKASRADFLRDDLRVDDLLAERERLLGRKAEIERDLIPLHEPHLRRDGDALFEQGAAWDFERSRLLPYRRVLRQLAKVEERLHGQTKFNLIARWRLADELWVLAAAGTVRGPSGIQPAASTRNRATGQGTSCATARHPMEMSHEAASSLSPRCSRVSMPGVRCGGRRAWLRPIRAS
ncbi:MAG: hypothetical protein ACKOJI_01370 [Phycisphaerales bacterium]